MTLAETKAAPADPNDWTWWQNALKGVRGEIHPDDPHTGYYRARRKGRPSDSPIFYWISTKTGEQRCHMDGQDYPLHGEDLPNGKRKPGALDIWPYASKNPVTKEAYDECLRTGTWPGESEAVTRSNNAPDDDSFEGLQSSIEEFSREAEKLMKAGAAKTQQQANEAADVADKLNKLFARADKARDTEKRPHLEAGREVDDKWRPLTTAASIYKRLKEVVAEPFLKAEKARKEKLEREAREAAAKAQREAAEKEVAAKRAAQDAVARGDAATAAKAQAEADAALARAQEAENKADAIASTPIKAGTRGRATSLRSAKVAKIIDYDKLLMSLKDHADIKEAVEKIANASARAGIALPGMELDKDEAAA